MPIEVTFFIPPHGQQTKQTITDISDEDAQWFTENNIKLSMEELMNGAKVIYADYGNPEEEATVISMPGRERTCRDMMAQLKRSTVIGLDIYNLHKGA